MKPVPPIDKRVRLLCQAMNSLPGIFTCSSSGGHAIRTRPRPF
jgi:hypothetical protein